MKFLIVALAPLLGITNQAKAQDLVLGVVRTFTQVGELDRNFCDIRVAGKHMRFEEGDQLVVVALDSCSAKYGNRRKDFYQVMYKGELAYIEKDALFVAPKGQQVLDELKVEDKQAFVESGKQASLTMRAMELEAALAAIDKTKDRGIALLSYGVYDVSEYTEGTGFKFRVINPTPKIIKYISMTVVGMNAVNDPVRTLRGSTSATFRGVGPIRSKEGGTYTFDYAWHTDLVESVKLVSIKVDYMDGTSRTIGNPLAVLIPAEHVRALDRVE